MIIETFKGPIQTPFRKDFERSFEETLARREQGCGKADQGGNAYVPDRGKRPAQKISTKTVDGNR